MSFRAAIAGAGLSASWALDAIACAVIAVCFVVAFVVVGSLALIALACIGVSDFIAALWRSR